MCAESIAGLPGSNAMVRVGPALSVSGPILGSTLFKLLRGMKTPLGSELRLCSPSMMSPK